MEAGPEDVLGPQESQLQAVPEEFREASLPHQRDTGQRRLRGQGAAGLRAATAGAHVRHRRVRESGHHHSRVHPEERRNPAHARSS